MMKQMFTDMKVSIKLVAESGIAETNATHNDGDTITLMEMDMGKLMENPRTSKNSARSIRMTRPPPWRPSRASKASRRR